MVKKAIEIARKVAKKAIENTYDGICSIVEYKDITDERTKITHQKEVVVIENQPCKLSFERLSAANQTEIASSISQGTKLFISPEIKVKSGSKIIVEQYGLVNEYSASGEPAIYTSHQEIMLELFRGWA